MGSEEECIRSRSVELESVESYEEIEILRHGSSEMVRGKPIFSEDASREVRYYQTSSG